MSRITASVLAEAMAQNATERAKFIADTRALLDLFEANPDLPLPWQFRGQHGPSGTEEEQRAEIDRIAAILGTEARIEAGGGHYITEIAIGSAVYVAVAITKKHMARYNEKQRLGAEAYEQLHGGAK